MPTVTATTTPQMSSRWSDEVAAQEEERGISLRANKATCVAEAGDDGENTRLGEKSLSRVQRHKAFTAAMDRALNSSRNPQNDDIGEMHGMRVNTHVFFDANLPRLQ